MARATSPIHENPGRAEAACLRPDASRESTSQGHEPFLERTAETLAVRAALLASRGDDIRSAVFLFDRRPALVEAISYETPGSSAAERRLCALIDERRRERAAAAFVYVTHVPEATPSDCGVLLFATRSADDQSHRAIVALRAVPGRLGFSWQRVTAPGGACAELSSLISLEVRLRNDAWQDGNGFGLRFLGLASQVSGSAAQRSAGASPARVARP